MKKLGLILYLCFCLVQPINLHAEESEYIVKDVLTDTTIGTYTTLEKARVTYDLNKEKYEELAILKQDKIIVVEYGVLSLPTGECKVNFEFKNAITQQDGYVNGCYGVDALYLDTDAKGTQVNFQIGGALGWGKLSEVTIIPFSQTSQLTSYIVLNGRLYHQIKSDLSLDKYSSLIELGAAPSYLSENQVVYSYDGHYFYDDFKLMSNNVRNQIHSGAINASDPFYNYYQFVTHRTMTNATAEAVRNYFQNTFQIKTSMSSYNDQDKDSVHDGLTQSQYYGSEKMFFQYQNQFGSNAMMMLALSMNESATGRSSLSFTRNNLFGHAAYDSDVEKNASRYLNVSNSVYSHAKNYISGSYLNPQKFQYHGGHFGDKASGMNVSYASDPYWGEKAAQFYARLDEALGLVDFNSQTLAIKTSSKSIPVTDETGKMLYETGKNPTLSFVVLGQTETQYKIQTDPALVNVPGNDAVNTYDYVANVGYIDIAEIDILLNPEAMHENDLVTIRFDAQEGAFNDLSKQVVYQMKRHDIPSCEAPVKANAIFVGWDKELDAVNQDTTYIAQYRTISSISMKTLPITTMEYNDRVNIENGSIEVIYEGGQKEVIPLTTSMISGYDTKLEGAQTVTVTYGGASTSYPLEVLMELDTARNEMKAEITAIIEEYSGKTEFTQEELARLSTLRNQLMDVLYPSLTFTEIRNLDAIYYQAIQEKMFTVIDKNPVNLAFTGLNFTVPSKTAFGKQWIKDTVRLFYHETIQDEKAGDLLKAVAEGNGYTLQTQFSLSGKLNFATLKLEDYVLVSMDIPEGIQDNQIITVLQYQDGQVIKLATQQSLNKLVFKTNVLSDYAMVTRNSTNHYTGQNKTETNMYENNGFNLFAVMSIVPWIVLAILAILLGIVISMKKRLIKKQKNLRNKRI